MDRSYDRLSTAALYVVLSTDANMSPLWGRLWVLRCPASDCLAASIKCLTWHKKIWLRHTQGPSWCGVIKVMGVPKVRCDAGNNVGCKTKLDYIAALVKCKAG